MSGKTNGFAARVLKDSRSKVSGHRFVTMEITLPRIVLAEFNTHRAFSRNSASSRAIPVAKQLERVTVSPFVPEYWGINQKGMQAFDELKGKEREKAIQLWIAADMKMCDFARELNALGVHKQLVNRLIEAFMWQTIIVSATEWSNYFALRANKAAQPEIRKIAELMLEAYQTSEPLELGEGQWHMPLIQDDEREWAAANPEQARMVSAARCARVSYMTHEGKRDIEADLMLFKRLHDEGHMSPFEHVATPITADEWRVRDAMEQAALNMGRIVGLEQLAIDQLVNQTQFNGNVRGWTQLRKLMRHEDDFGAVDRAA